MGISVHINQDAIRQKVQDAVNAKMLKVFQQAGEQAVEVAKQTKTYQDITGNLTNSIGYAIVQNGGIVEVGGFGSAEGESAGMEVINNHLQDFQSSIGLILVAGMSYAVYVERKGYSVLDGARLQMLDLIKRAYDGQ